MKANVNYFYFFIEIISITIYFSIPLLKIFDIFIIKIYFSSRNICHIFIKKFRNGWRWLFNGNIWTYSYWWKSVGLHCSWSKRSNPFSKLGRWWPMLKNNHNVLFQNNHQYTIVCSSWWSSGHLRGLKSEWEWSRFIGQTYG